MSSTKIVGKILEIGTLVKVSDKFQKLEFVLETQDQYPQVFGIQLVQDKIEQIARYSVDDIVEVSINIRGRAWRSPQTGETKYFTSLDAWKISEVGANTNPQESKHWSGLNGEIAQDQLDQGMSNDLDGSDVPF